MKYIDLFAGIGGFRYGLENVKGSGELGQKESISKQRGADTISKPDKRQHTFTCVYTNEWDKYAAQIYKKHYGECDTTDITKVKAKDIPDHDLLTAGFPCQSFSVAGKRKGFKDTRGTLFFDIARILSEKRPRYLLLENVKGLLSHDKGKTFQTILGVLSDLGYRVEWQVLNSKHFGVPQNRERVFIIGHLGGFGGRKVFPIGENSKENTRKDKVSTLPRIFKETERLSDAFRIRDTKGDSATLKGLGGGLGAKTGLYAVPIKYLDRNQKNYQGKYSFTIDSVNTGGIMKDTRIRRLTPTECERLQGFPDGWTKKGIDKDGKEVVISDTQRYKVLGNAVTTNVIESIGRKLCGISCGN